MNAPLVAAGLILLAQTLPPELRPQQDKGGFDPALPAAIAPAVARASEAELDPKRGTANAKEILAAEQRRVSGDRELDMALQVRFATTVLRARFSSNDQVEKSTAVQQALSTYAKLDISDPGLAQWIERAVEATPGAKEAFAKDQRKIKVAVLARGEGLDANVFANRLDKLVDASGVDYEKAAPKDAVYILKLAADHVRAPGEVPLVRVTLEIGKPGRTPFKHNLFRTVEAKDAKVAVAAAVEWLARIGGRDLLFHWLTEHGLPAALPISPATSGHAGHPH